MLVAIPTRIPPAGKAGQAAGTAMGAPSATSAWNVGGTWEERDVSGWARSELEVRLLALSLPPLQVVKVSGIDGHASVISNRGKVKRPFELKCDIEWEIALTDSERCEGVTSYVEISPAPSSARMPCTYETSEHFTAPPKGDEVVRTVRAELARLQQRVDGALEGLVNDLATK
uniref:Activator of Hsp90 ATPase AHSA1-like N-terminal domain-containing protein n=2 Tax=Haptolina brevifila TaxID=156173 RepID=A0A7S2DEG7_9EUKA|mmetsp:Transcript_37161/g.74250  ORF Transcript_37161/g.74250 Transcript_37161/m.74250 type:complete len:173 (+) Transcript_37161:751-1269(+)